MEKYKKSHTKVINLKYHLQHGIKNLNHQMDRILYQIFKIILNISLKKHKRVAENPSIKIYVHKLENRITFNIKTEYYLELFTPETMKLRGSTKTKINKNKNGENVPQLEINRVILIHFNIIHKDYKQNSRALYIFVLNKSFGQLLDISPNNFIFLIFVKKRIFTY